MTRNQTRLYITFSPDMPFQFRSKERWLGMLTNLLQDDLCISGDGPDPTLSGLHDNYTRNLRTAWMLASQAVS